MGCQKAIAQKIQDRGGDYILTVKENQEHLLEDIQQALAQAFDTDFAGLEHDTYATRERAHGREEYRCYTVLHHITGLRHADAWVGLTTIGMCYSERTVRGVTSEEVRYFIGGKKARAKVYGKALRGHWAIENSLHWHLDVTFDEDDNRVTKRNAAEDLALLPPQARKWHDVVAACAKMERAMAQGLAAPTDSKAGPAPGPAASVPWTIGIRKYFGVWLLRSWPGPDVPNPYPVATAI